MSFLLTCPNCGERRVDEFRFGGELRARPQPDALTPREWRAYLYERANVAGEQREWWYHRHGCKRWFVARRDTRTNTVLATGWFGEDVGALPGERDDR
jgi:heterotetrameric sarcosine oxidase delta subunit